MDLVTYALCKKLAKGGGSGLPDVTTADDGKVLKVASGVWDTGYNIHWLDGGSTYLPFTQILLSVVTNAMPTMLQNNYMSYTVKVDFNATVEANVLLFADELFEALSNSETPIYRSTGITGFNDMICPLKYADFDPDSISEGFDILFSSFIYYWIPDVGLVAATAEVSITHRDDGTRMFVKIDRLVDGAHS